MNWTDERVELLKKLWSEGLSASQIAAELGGVSRNAVIGKVHRLKLSGRGKTTKASPRVRKVAAPQPLRPVVPEAEEAVVARAPVPPLATHTSNPQELEIEFADPSMTTTVDSTDDVVIPMSRHLSLLQLSENTCKWPIGDPLSDEFYFCGADSGDSSPYCSYHSKLAFQPISDRRRKAS